jgi:hypothetical protein
VTRRIVLLVAFMLVSACDRPAPSPSPLPAGVYAVPTIDTSKFDACAGIGVVDAHLTGDPHDPRIAWLAGSYGRREVVFPSRFTARFAPELEILDAAGAVVAREGQVITGGCVTGGDTGSALLILWP